MQFVALYLLGIAAGVIFLTMKTANQGVQASVKAIIRARALEYGLDAPTMLAFAARESSFNPKAQGDFVYKNGVKYATSFGLFQIQEISYKTTLQFGYQPVAVWKDDADGNAVVAMRYATVLIDMYKRRYAKEPTGSELREMWTLGPTKFFANIRNPLEAKIFEKLVVEYS